MCHCSFAVGAVSQPSYHTDLFTRFSRLFSSHIGLTSLEQLKMRIYPVDASAKFFRSLKQLDRTSSRECHKIGVVYVGPGQENQREILKNERGSADYESFLHGLGWDVDLGMHSGFLGGLDPNYTTGRTAPYFCTSSIEVIFHAVTRMPTNKQDEQQIHKKRHVGNDIVNIVWSENSRDYRPNTITSQFNDAHIVVYPLSSSLYRIRIHCKEGTTLFGPLWDGMLVPRNQLAPLVRATAINANKACRYRREGYKRPYPTRSDVVQEIMQRYTVEPSILDWCTSVTL